MSIDEERALVAAAKTDPQAFGVIFDTYYRKILTYVLRRTGSVAAAEEIVGETFMKAYKSLPSFRWRGISIEAWLFKIAVNELRMYFRRAHKAVSLEVLQQKEGFELPADYDLVQEAEEAQEKLARHEQFVRAQQLIRSLPPAYQDVLVLRYVEGKKISEIAHIVGKKEGTVKSLLSRGLARVRLELSKQPLQPAPQVRITRDGIVTHKKESGK